VDPNGIASAEQMSRRPGRPIDTAWAALPVLLPAFALLLDRMRAVDLAYHVRLGAQIIDAGTIPSTDTFTFTVSGQPWVDQQWLAQVVFSTVHRMGGWDLLWTLRGALGAVAFGFIYLACRARGASPRAASGLSMAGLTVGYFNLGMRPQMLAIPLFAAALWAVASRKHHPWRLAILPAAALVTANVHGSFPLLVALGVLATLEDLIGRDAAWRRTAAWTGGTMLATFVTPSGPAVWGYVVDIATDPQIRAKITEWEPLRLDDPSGALAAASVLAIAAWLARRGRPAPWASLIWLGAFLVPALATQRSILWWALVAPVVIAGIDGTTPDPPPTARVTTNESRMPARVLVSTLIVAVILALPIWRAIPEDQILDDAPPGLTAAIRERLPAGTRTLIHQPWASWFEYATPDIPVFVDSRIELYRAEVWDAYGSVAFAGAGWAEALDEWDVEAIVAEADWELLPRLRQDPGWRVVAEDQDGALLIRV